MSAITFHVEHDPAGERFPYRISIRSKDGPLVMLRATSPWPGAGQQVFCLPEKEPDMVLTTIEEVPVIEYSRMGKRLTFSLDRPMRKRAEFLFIDKPNKARTGTYQQIFFRTQAGIEAHRSKGKMSLYGNVELNVIVDSAERYGWNLPGANIRRRKMAAGDYGLLLGERIVAVIERKTFPNLLSDIYAAKVLHQKFAELAAYPRAAFVIEGHYNDLMAPKKIGVCSKTHLVRAVSELAASYPTVQIVWAGNRRDAAVWAVNYFTAVERALTNTVAPALEPMGDLFAQPNFEGGDDQRIRARAIELGKDDFSLKVLVAEFSPLPKDRVTRIVKSLREEGVLESSGHGPGTRWRTRVAA